MTGSKETGSLPALCEEAGFVIGTSPAVQHLLDELQRVADSDLPVLIFGPTGSGKDVIASLLHQLGSPVGSPFLDVNCGAIPESLIESQLFGHEKGAFTGALHRQSGYFSLAADGVLFLDEVAELPLWQQVRLLRVLETRQFRPVGGTINYHFRGRVIAATHVDLEKRVAEDRFREDLYYRLNVVQLRVPPLEERREDIPLLVKHFADRHPRAVSFTPAALTQMAASHWKGNIRELKNTVDRILIMASTDRIDVDVVQNYVSTNKENLGNSTRIDELATELLQLEIPNKLAAIEYATIQMALQNAHGNKSSAARKLGVHRKYIERRLNSFEERLEEIKKLNTAASEKMDRSEYQVAIKDLRKALQYLERGYSPQGHDDIKLDLLLKLSACLRNTHGWNDSEVVSLYEDAQQLTRKLNQPEKLISVQFGTWVNQLVQLNLEAALAITTAYWREGMKINNPNVTAQAAISMANTHYWMGDYQQTVSALHNFIDLYSHDRRIVIDIGHDPFVYYLMFKSLVFFQQGKVNLSIECLCNLMSYAREVNQPFSLATALQVGAWLSYKLRDLVACYAYAQELFDLSKEHGFPFFIGIAEIFLGHRTALDGDYKGARQTIIAGFRDKLNGGKGRLFNAMYGIILADIAIEAKQYKQGLKDIEETIIISQTQKEYCYLAEEQIMRGRLNLLLGAEEQGMGDFETALSTAQKRGSKAAELKASYALARFYCDRRQRSEARCILTPIALRYTEQQVFYDLEQAKYLLASIDNRELRLT